MLREAWDGAATFFAQNVALYKTGFNLEIPGKRQWGRTRQRWLDARRHGLEASWDAPDQAFDRAKWR